MLEIFIEAINNTIIKNTALIVSIASVSITLIIVNRSTHTMRLNNLKTILDLKKELSRLNEKLRENGIKRYKKEITNQIENIEAYNEGLLYWQNVETIINFYHQKYLTKDDLEKHFKRNILNMYLLSPLSKDYNELIEQCPQAKKMCESWIKKTKTHILRKNIRELLKGEYNQKIEEEILTVHKKI